VKDAGGALTAATLTLSVLIHGAAIGGAESVFRLHGGDPLQTKALRAAKDKRNAEKPIQFQFIEAPKQIVPERPRDSGKIAARDSVSRDVSTEKDPDSSAPSTKKTGVADQLAQRRGAPAAAPVPPQAPAEAKPLSHAVQEATDQGEMSVPLAPKPAAQPEAQNAPPSQPQQTSPAQEPKTEVHGLTGNDKITTEELTRLKAKARFTGITSFEATGSGMGEYMQNLKERIWLAWFPYLSFKYPGDFKTADCVISLTIDKYGSLKIVKLVEQSGSVLFATFCVESVQRAAPFGKLPEELLALTGKEDIELFFAFHYR
jgi:hypothetical protein